MGISLLATLVTLPVVAARGAASSRGAAFGLVDRAPNPQICVSAFIPGRLSLYATCHSGGTCHRRGLAASAAADMPVVQASGEGAGRGRGENYLTGWGSVADRGAARFDFYQSVGVLPKIRIGDMAKSCGFVIFCFLDKQVCAGLIDANEVESVVRIPFD